MNKQVFIMRGLPGSGKSFWVNGVRGLSIVNIPSVVCSADFYHMRGNKYEFQPSKVGEAHKQCLMAYLKELQQHTHTIFVDNTNTTAHEISPYYRLAELYGYDAKIIYVICPFEVCVKRQAHNVPIQTMMRMARNLIVDPLPDRWNIELVESN